MLVYQLRANNQNISLPFDRLKDLTELTHKLELKEFDIKVYEIENGMQYRSGNTILNKNGASFVIGVYYKEHQEHI